MDYQTDRSRANGLGSAKEGTDHWWQQRVTAVALIPLGLLFIFPFAMVIGEGYEAALALYEHPLHAIVACLFILVAFNHLRLGLQVVLATTLFCFAFAFAGVFAVAKIAFNG
jgi:succinate dehydrogenase / fumarate reductase membrane anchor subunit